MKKFRNFAKKKINSYLNNRLIEDGEIKLSWARSSTPLDVSNYGDALSPLIVSALSRKKCKLRAFDKPSTRLVSTGTIGHNIHSGTAHFWGTGFDKSYNPLTKKQTGYAVPKSTKIIVHSLRGRMSQKLLQSGGVKCPDIYGDPVWLLPNLLPNTIEKKYELGVIIHLTEIDSYKPTANPIREFSRYQIPEHLKNKIKIINTVIPASAEGIIEKTNEILSCKRIATTSLHGIVIPEAYEIPCIYFPTYSGGRKVLSIFEESSIIDHRFRDLYSGLNIERIPAYAKDRTSGPTDWEDLIDYIDETWEKKEFQKDDFVASFPLGKPNLNPISLSELEKILVF
ncbi:polysaccharide pyruvyl transferase family protein [Microbulbifer sp. DLAB2-AA]|uniref:polysaccharide pyruvyl transferase family protein n=1 Tax=Microbulbifer sp. DLAB2-AA TaxID=3243394 RepID=UPI004039D74E